MAAFADNNMVSGCDVNQERKPYDVELQLYMIRLEQIYERQNGTNVLTKSMKNKIKNLISGYSQTLAELHALYVVVCEKYNESVEDVFIGASISDEEQEAMDMAYAEQEAMMYDDDGMPVFDINNTAKIGYALSLCTFGKDDKGMEKDRKFCMEVDGEGDYNPVISGKDNIRYSKIEEKFEKGKKALVSNERSMEVENGKETIEALKDHVIRLRMAKKHLITRYNRLKDTTEQYARFYEHEQKRRVDVLLEQKRQIDDMFQQLYK